MADVTSIADPAVEVRAYHRPIAERPAAVRPLAHLSRAIVRICTVIVTLLLVVMLVAALVQILSRSFSFISAGGPEELARLAMTTLVFLGLPVVTAHAQHISIDLLQERLRGGVARSLSAALVLALEIVFLVLLGLYTWDLVDQLIGAPDRTTALNLPTLWTRVPMLLGLVLAVVVALDALIGQLENAVRAHRGATVPPLVTEEVPPPARDPADVDEEEAR